MDSTEERKDVTEERKDVTEERKEATEERKDSTEERKDSTEERKEATEERKEATEERPFNRVRLASGGSGRFLRYQIICCSTNGPKHKLMNSTSDQKRPKKKDSYILESGTKRKNDFDRK